MSHNGLAAELRSTHEFFNRSISCLSEEDSSYTPVPGTRTVAQQVAHTAQTVEWFLEGAFRPEGFGMDFEGMEKPVAACTSLTEARAWLDRAFEAAVADLAGRSDAEMAELLPEGPIMGGAPRAAIVGAVVDHTAHHRGALTVYARLLGKVPAMPYGM